MQMNSMTVHGQEVHFQSSEDLSNIPSHSVDFIITSPPYWNLKNYGTPGEIGQADYETYLANMNAVWQECYRVAKPDAVLVINVANRRYKKKLYPIAFDIVSRMKGWELWDTPIWYVPNALPQPNHYIERLLDSKFEFLLVFTRDGNTNYYFDKPRVPQKYAAADPRQHKKNPLGRCIGNIIRIPAYRPPNVKKLGYHVAAYPEELIAFFLQCYTRPEDTILDPFLGSGTTLKVARAMGRNGIGIELNADFASLIEKRIGERFEIPDWRDLDIIHSTRQTTGTTRPRKIHLLKNGTTDPALFES